MEWLQAKIGGIRVAEYTVNTLAEFIALIERSSSPLNSNDTVNCPENAIWDWNTSGRQMTPYSMEVLAKQINGNGTTLKNFRGIITGSHYTSTSSGYTKFQSFNIIDAFGERTYDQTYFLKYLYISGSKISAKLNSVLENFLYDGLITSCTCTVEALYGNNFKIVGGGYTSTQRSRFKIINNNAASIELPTMNDKYPNEYVLNCPNATKLIEPGPNLFSNCTIRGDLSKVQHIVTSTSSTGVATNIIEGNLWNRSAFSVLTIPSAANQWFVTDEGMKSVEAIRQQCPNFVIKET